MTVARRWTEILGRLGLTRPGLDVYVFGKHPAWPDFIDVARLPPVPESFRYFHDRLRSGVDAAYTGPDAIARFLLWQSRGRSGVIGVYPSRDGGHPRTGHFRRSPLLIGASAMVPLPTLLEFAGNRIESLAGRLVDPLVGQNQAITAISSAASSWRADFRSVALPTPEIERPPPRDEMPASESHGQVLARAADAVTHFVTDRTPVVLTVAAAPAGLQVARDEWDRLEAESLRGALSAGN